MDLSSLLNKSFYFYSYRIYLFSKSSMFWFLTRKETLSGMQSQMDAHLTLSPWNLFSLLKYERNMWQERYFETWTLHIYSNTIPTFLLKEMFQPFLYCGLVDLVETRRSACQERREWRQNFRKIRENEWRNWWREVAKKPQRGEVETQRGGKNVKGGKLTTGEIKSSNMG